MANWSERYIKSQSDFSSKNKLEYCVPTHDHIQKLTNEYCSEELPAFESALTILANLKLYEYAVTGHCLLGKCESPIEKQMALALWVCGNAITGTEVEIDVTVYTQKIPEPYQLIIKPQTKIGEYRVDFLLQYRTIFPKIENQKIIRDFESCKQLIIECDGHEFHEKTKEQSKRDKERDRLMQSMGYLVFRYTGSEIWNDAFKCASESIRAIIDSTEEDARKVSEA